MAKNQRHSKIQAYSRALEINNEIQALSRPAGDPVHVAMM